MTLCFDARSITDRFISDMPWLAIFILLWAAGSLTMALGNEQSVGQQRVQATEVFFKESEHGIDPHLIRMLFSEKGIRIDQGAGSQDYVLYDLQKHHIFSVLNNRRRVLIINPEKKVAPTPDTLMLTEQMIADQQIPTINGLAPVYRQFRANKQLCYHVISVDGLLPTVTEQLRQYQTVLAAQQQALMQNTPVQLRTDCYLANYLYAPAWYLQYGFPIRQWDMNGYLRELDRYQTKQLVDASLFQLPKGFSYFTISDNQPSGQ